MGKNHLATQKKNSEENESWKVVREDVSSPQ